jgi:hypothetical protein
VACGFGDHQCRSVRRIGPSPRQTSRDAPAHLRTAPEPAGPQSIERLVSRRGLASLCETSAPFRRASVFPSVAWVRRVTAEH